MSKVRLLVFRHPLLSLQCLILQEVVVGLKPAARAAKYFGPPCGLELIREMTKSGSVIAGKGSVFSTPNDKFEVEKKLSEGGCGQVYLVRRSRDKRQFALKTEEKKADKSTKRLKVLLPPPRIKKLQKELFTYKGVMRTQKNAAWRTDHLLSCIAIGHNQVFNFVVMPLLGASVKELLDEGKIDFVSAMRMCIQMFNGIRQLHKLGFMHRDLKPDNFMFKGGSSHGRLLLMDYGMATYYETNFTDANEKSAQEETQKSLQGISIQLHRNDGIRKSREPPSEGAAPQGRSRVLDLCGSRRAETYVHQVIELFHPDILPWGKVDSESATLALKDSLIEGGIHSVWMVVPREIKTLLCVVAKLKRQDKPHYDWMLGMLKVLSLLEDGHPLQNMCLDYGVPPYGPFPFMNTLE